MATVQEEEWLLWCDGAHSPAFNMAADTVMLEEAPHCARPLLRFYSWDRPAVSIGYVQRYDAAPAGYAVVRRPTGGGVVYHDCDFTYSIAFPPGHWLGGLDRNASYDWLNRTLQNALARLGIAAELSQQQIPHAVDRAKMICFTNPTRYDLLLNGRKIAGSAQRRTANGVLHQGSLNFGTPLPVEREALITAFLAAAREVMHAHTTPFAPNAQFLAAIESCAQNRYDTVEWNHLR
jgi:lipoate-protein ligase A